MTQLIVLTGPQGSGKTQIAAHLAEHYQLANTLDEWNGKTPSIAELSVVPGGCLAITNADLALEAQPGLTLLDIETAKELLS